MKSSGIWWRVYKTQGPSTFGLGPAYIGRTQFAFPVVEELIVSRDAIRNLQ